jgi:hypothetical protein
MVGLCRPFSASLSGYFGIVSGFWHFVEIPYKRNELMCQRKLYLKDIEGGAAPILFVEPRIKFYINVLIL